MTMKWLKVIVIGFMLFGKVAWAQDFILTPSMSADNPSIDKGHASCYDVRTRVLLNCEFRYVLSKGAYDGGHIAHNSPRPIGGLRFSGHTGKGITSLSFNSLWDVVYLEYVIPEVSGEIKLTITAIPPDPYRCVSNCFVERMGFIQVEGLEPMPASADGYWRLTGANGEPGVTSLHLFNHYGTSSTVGALSLIAWRYFEDTGGDSLGINDISLPKGGLFDINNDWVTPHSEHRAGTDADIDRDGFDCEVDGLLWEAIEFVNKYGYVSGGQPKADLLCESRGRKHIDFD